VRAFSPAEVTACVGGTRTALPKGKSVRIWFAKQTRTTERLFGCHKYDLGVNANNLASQQKEILARLKLATAERELQQQATH
jgi:hypothetical protein